MGVIVLNKEKFEEGTAGVDFEVVELVDAYGAVLAELEEVEEQLAPLRKMAAAMKKDLHNIAEEEDPTEAVTLDGHTYKVKMSAKAKKVLDLNKEELRNILGDDLYFQLADIKIGDVRRYCTPPQIGSVITEDLVGPRRLSVKKK